MPNNVTLAATVVKQTVELSWFNLGAAKTFHIDLYVLLAECLTNRCGFKTHVLNIAETRSSRNNKNATRTAEVLFIR